MARKRYIETHSNYTLRKLHQTTSKGDIFESDLMTITEPGAFAPGQIPIYNDSNFKLSFRRGVTQKLKHETGAWITDADGETTGSTSTIPGTSSYIRLRPNHNSILDFACYGSAKELVRASLTDIITNFPGELFLTHENYEYFPTMSSTTTEALGGKDWYVVENPFLLNLIASVIPANSFVPEVRYFCKHFRDYIFIPDALKEKSYISWGSKKITNSKCPVNGDIIYEIYLGICNLRYYYLNGKMILLHNYKYGTAHIRPNDSYLANFYNNLDDFEYLLINRLTNNTAELLTPRETSKGMFERLEKYQWPTVHGWNIDFESSNYQSYMNRLLDVAEIYDNYFSDNVIRSMTHEAIKNFDWTLTKELDNSERVLEDPNPYRIESILRVLGREFDNIKMFARGIKDTNSVSYGGANNLPDYFLSDTLELSGWEVKNPLSGDGTIVTDVLYPGTYYGYTFDDANNQFMKRLKLSSNEIMNAKGTKRGLEMLLALFGFHSMDYYKKRLYEVSGEVKTWAELYEVDEEGNEKVSDLQSLCYGNSYDISEFEGIALNTGNTAMTGYERCDNAKVREINAYRDGYHLPVGDRSSLDEIELQGLPVKPVEIEREDGTTTTYLVPWYDNTQDYSTYFQSKGGWGITDIKKTDIATFGPIEIVSDDSFTIYDETQKYLHFCDTLSNLIQLPYSTINTGDIYYVEDITELSSLYVGTISGTASHYFILENENSCTSLGEDEEGVIGWRSISLEEITGQTSTTGKKILYLESIINDNKGNNPHTGNGSYDGGVEYIKSLYQLFENYTFNNVSDSKVSEKDSLGFDIEIQKDNIKCWYFTDTNREKPSLIELSLNEDGGFDAVGESTKVGTEIFINTTLKENKVGSDFIEDNGALRETDLKPYNMEGTGVINDEAAANSIINLKNFSLIFNPDVKLGFSQYDFINDIVLYYVKQLIPSTTITYYHIPDTDSHNQICGKPVTLGGMANSTWVTG